MLQLFKKITAKLNNKYFLSLAGNCIMSVIGLATTAIVYRSLSLADNGVWIFFTAAVILVDTFRSGFLTTAFIKFYSGSSTERTTDVIGSTWYIAIIITLILSLLNLPVLFFLDSISDNGLRLFFKWFSPCIWLILPYFVGTCIVQGEQRFDRLLYLRAIQQGTLILSIICCIIFLEKLLVQHLIYAYLFSYFVPSIFVLLNGWARLNTLGKRTRSTVKELYHFGKFSVGTTVNSNLFKASDTFIINFMLGPAALAIYNIGQSLTQIIEIPLRSFVATGMPDLSVAYNQNKKGEVIAVMKKYIGMLTVIMVPACLFAVLFADFAIRIIGGGKYVGTEAANVFRIFMTFALLYPADRFFAVTLDVIHKPKINFIKVLVMMIANVLSDFAGIYVLGNIYGIALASLIPTLIGVTVGYLALQNYKGFSFWGAYSTGFYECRLFLRQFFSKTKPSPI